MSIVYIYIAGPYTKGDVAQNVATAIDVADQLSYLDNVAVFIPHLTHFWHMLKPHDYEFWMTQDQYWLDKCNIVLRLPGFSAGADREVEYAKDHGKKVYYNLPELMEKIHENF
jgi:hypothetical protein